jgi:hypothetical protein
LRKYCYGFAVIFDSKAYLSAFWRSLLSGVEAIAPLLSRQLIRSQSIDPERL